MIWTSDTTKKAMKLHSFLVRRRLGVHFTHHASRHGLSRAVKFCAGWNKNCSSDPYEICCGYMGGICAMRDGRSLDSQCVNQLPKYIKNTQNSSSVPLEFPKLANTQPSNFGPLRIFILLKKRMKKGWSNFAGGPFLTYDDNRRWNQGPNE